MDLGIERIGAPQRAAVETPAIVAEAALTACKETISHAIGNYHRSSQAYYAEYLMEEGYQPFEIERMLAFTSKSPEELHEADLTSFGDLAVECAEHLLDALAQPRFTCPGTFTLEEWVEAALATTDTFEFAQRFALATPDDVRPMIDSAARTLDGMLYQKETSMEIPGRAGCAFSTTHAIGQLRLAKIPAGGSLRTRATTPWEVLRP